MNPGYALLVVGLTLAAWVAVVCAVNVWRHRAPATVGRHRAAGARVGVVRGGEVLAAAEADGAQLPPVAHR